MAYGTYTVREILCDEPDCFETCEIVGGSKREVRASAKGDGWLCDSTGDWCPAHNSLTGPPSRKRMMTPDEWAAIITPEVLTDARQQCRANLANPTEPTGQDQGA